MTLFNLLSGGADEAGGDLAVVECDFALADEQTDLSGAGVLHVGNETFVRGQLFLWSEGPLGITTGESAGSGGSDHQGAGGGASNYRDRGSCAGVLEKHPSTYRFHAFSS